MTTATCCKSGYISSHVVTWPQARIIVAFANIYDTISRVIYVVFGLILVQCKVRVVKSREVKCRKCPHIALAYALEEDVNIKAFPAAANTEAVLVAWQHVTNYLNISVVFQSTLSSINLTVAVKVLVFDVTRAENEVVVLNSGLVSNACFINPFAAGVLAVKVILGEIAVCFKAPYVAPCLAFIRIRNVIGMSYELVAGVPFGYFNLRVADREVGIRCQILVKLMTPCQRQLPAT